MANTSGVRIDFESVRIDPKEVQKMLGDRSGPIIRAATEVSQKVQTKSRTLVGGESGVLKNSIVKRFVKDGAGPHIEVGVFSGPALGYALFHHEGTRPHVILGNPLLVFFWKKIGETAFLRSVNHPGTKANRFLTNAARQLGLKVRAGR